MQGGGSARPLHSFWKWVLTDQYFSWNMLHPYVSMLLIVRAGGSGCRRKRKRRTTTTAMKKRRKRTALQIQCEEQRYPGTSSCSVVKALWLSEWSQWSDVMTWASELNIGIWNLSTGCHWWGEERKEGEKREKGQRRKEGEEGTELPGQALSCAEEKPPVLWSREGHRRRPYDLILVPLELPEPGKVREKREEREKGWNWHVLRCYQVTIIIYIVYNYSILITVNIIHEFLPPAISARRRRRRIRQLGTGISHDETTFAATEKHRMMDGWDAAPCSCNVNENFLIVRHKLTYYWHITSRYN